MALPPPAGAPLLGGVTGAPPLPPPPPLGAAAWALASAVACPLATSASASLGPASVVRDEI